MPPLTSTPPPMPPPIPGAPSGQSLSPNEQVVSVIRRHPVGLVVIYLEVLIAVAALIFLAIIILPDFFHDLSGRSTTLALFAVLLLALVFFILFLLTTVYRQNELIITNQAVTQTLSSGPFNQKMSRLSMADVEDVTSDQSGFLPSIFNYGVLNIETSGELRNFIFKYCPNPNLYATEVSKARQSYASQNPNN